MMYWGIQQIPDGHSERSAQSAVKAAEEKRTKDADRISQVDGCSVASGKLYLYLKEREHHIGEGGHKTG